MNIVIAGAGTIGAHIAKLLSRGEHDITLIDRDPKRLREASWNVDIATRVGEATDWELLDELLEINPDVFMALTSSQEANLVAASIAKNLGFPKTVARIEKGFINTARLDMGRIFCVDHLVAPELLTAHEILKLVYDPSSLFVEHFAEGAVQMRTFRVPKSWHLSSTPLAELSLPANAMIALLYRARKHMRGEEEGLAGDLFFPHGDTCIQVGDEITVVGETQVMEEVSHFFGLRHQKVSSAVIVGGSATAMHLAGLLEREGVAVRLVEKDRERCKELVEELSTTTIINEDGTDSHFLRSEKVGRASMTIACGRDDAENMMVGLLAQQVGAARSIVVIGHESYTELAPKLGLDHVISPPVAAANKILTLTLSGRISSVTSLYRHRAEVVEVAVSPDSPLVGIPLIELGPLLPRDLLIVMIENRGRNMIANGSRIISPRDRVILVTHPDHLKEIEKIF